MLRSRALALILVLAVAVPAAGCLKAINPARAGIGESSWAAEMVQVPALKDEKLTGADVRVAIIDTGIDLSHPEFRGTNVLWADLVNRKGDPYDDNGHGTHVAGIIKAQGDYSTLLSGFYLKGMAPDVQLIIIKAITADGTGDESRVAAGVRTAVANGAHVIVLSLGGGTFPILGTDTERAVGEAIDKGVFVVAAAGNLKDGEGSCSVTSPASVAGVIAVGAVSESRTIADFSCRGTDNEARLAIPPVTGRSDPDKKPEVVAPGVDILSAWKDGKYVKASGTSQAAPIVGAVLALILEAEPSLKRKDAETVQRVKDKMMVTSAKIGPLANKGATAHDDAYGYGLLQGEALLKALR